MGFQFIGEEDEMDIYQIKLENSALTHIKQYLIKCTLLSGGIALLTPLIKKIRKKTLD